MMWIADWMKALFGEWGAIAVATLVTLAIVAWWRHEHRSDRDQASDGNSRSES